MQAHLTKKPRRETNAIRFVDFLQVFDAGRFAWSSMARPKTAYMMPNMTINKAVKFHNA